MSITTTHSAKGIATLRLMGCDTTGWALPPITWETRVMLRPTKQACTTCQGTGQTPDLAARATAADATTPGERQRLRHANLRCPTCPPRLRWRSHGTGRVTVWVPREVEVAIIQWPAGTRFHARFESSTQCALCAKRITRMMPVLGTDAAGQPHGMWVGADCARTILTVSSKGTPMTLAAEHAATAKDDRDARSLWREIQPEKPVKPAKPSLSAPTPKAPLVDLINASGLPTTSMQYECSKATLRFSFDVRVAGRSYGESYEVVISARYGAVVRSAYDPATKPFLKDKTQFDALVALRAALPQIAAHAGTTLAPTLGLA